MIRCSRHVALAFVTLATLVPGAAISHQVEVEIVCPAPESEPVFLPVTAHTVQCDLVTGVDSDVFTFFTLAGARIRVMAASEDDHLDPRLIVRDPMGAPLSDTFCDGGSAAVPGPRCAALYDFIAPLEGLYEFELRDEGADESGSYTLQVEELPGAVDDLIDQDVFNDFDVLEIPTDMDHHRVMADEGDTIEIEVLSCGDYMDPRIEAWGPDGALLADVHCTTLPGPPPPITGPVTCSDDEPESMTLCTALAEFDVELSGIQNFSLSDEGSNGRGRYDYTVTRMPEPGSVLLGLSAALTVAAVRRRGRRA
jgi:hypothetical protein